MTGYDMVNEYYSWLLDCIDIHRDNHSHYLRALQILFDREFIWSISNDENRAYDGLSLRDQFSSEYDYPKNFWLGYLPNYCSVLEMMIGLARRCEIEIMHDPDFGDRTPVWFWIMFDNLGLNYYPDESFENEEDSEYLSCSRCLGNSEMCDGCTNSVSEVNEIIDIFLGRKYEKTGKGNIFIVRNPKIRLSKTEIWYQMQYFLSENF